MIKDYTTGHRRDSGVIVTVTFIGATIVTVTVIFILTVNVNLTVTVTLIMKIMALYHVSILWSH